MEPRISPQEICIDALIIGLATGGAILGIELSAGNHQELKDVLEHRELYTSIASASALYLSLGAIYRSFGLPRE